MSNFSNIGGDSSGSPSEDFVDAEDNDAIKAAKRGGPHLDEFSYTERDVLLYNLGIGAKADELKWTFENADGFEVRSFYARLGEANIRLFQPLESFPSSAPLVPWASKT